MSTLPLFGPAIPPELEGDSLRVASLLLDHRGKGRLTSRQIAAALGWPDTQAASVRRIVTRLIDRYSLPIARDRSRENGGYEIVDFSEADGSEAANLSQALTTFERVRRRLGERRFRALLVRLKVHEALGIERIVMEPTGPQGLEGRA